MSHPCPGHGSAPSCGHELSDCCEGIAQFVRRPGDEPITEHRSVCTVREAIRMTYTTDQVVFRVNGTTLHIGWIEAVPEWPRAKRLICLDGCDLSKAVTYDPLLDPVTQEPIGMSLLAEADESAICPRLLARAVDAWQRQIDRTPPTPEVVRVPTV